VLQKRLTLRGEASDFREMDVRLNLALLHPPRQIFLEL